MSDNNMLFTILLLVIGFVFMNNYVLKTREKYAPFNRIYNLKDYLDIDQYHMDIGNNFKKDALTPDQRHNYPKSGIKVCDNPDLDELSKYNYDNHCSASRRELKRLDASITY